MRNAIKLIGVFLACFLGTGVLPAQGTSLKHRNVIDLITLSELILVGRVTAVFDDFENGVPYTEVTVAVGEVLKGNPGGVYTFRQFGLRSPRTEDNGYTYLGVSPQGWPRFETGEEVMLFLYKRASMTGFRTTVGLFQGKFNKKDGRFVNAIENLGLFRNVSVNPGLLTPIEEKMLTVKKGPVRAETFVSFVRTAVEQRWVESGKLGHVK